MADPAKISEEDAYKKFTAALRRGQAGLDELDPEVKKLAKGPAEASLGRPSWSDPNDPSSEGYDIVEEVAPPTVKEDPSAEGYEPIEAVAPPDPDAGKEYQSREDYKGFKMPKGMSDEQSEAWKAGVDDRLLEEDERLQERIESAHPADQAKDLLRRASEGDMEAIKDIGYLGLNIGSMSPIGQIPQMAADVGVGAMDLAEGDYTGAAISGAAVILPVTAGMLKAAIKNPTAAKLVSKLDDTVSHDSGDLTRPLSQKYGYMLHLNEGKHVTDMRGTFPEVLEMSDDALIDTYKGLLDADNAVSLTKRELSAAGKDYTETAKGIKPTPELLSAQDAQSRLWAVERYVDNEISRRLKTVEGFSDKLNKASKMEIGKAVKPD